MSDKIIKDSRVPEGTFVVGNKLYAVCADCGGLVQVNKPLLGSLHLCVEEVPG